MKLKHESPAREAHEQMKRDPELWERMTIYLGEQPSRDGGTLELANCVVCDSTLSKRRKARQ
jgi:hypothetical protein